MFRDSSRGNILEYKLNCSKDGGWRSLIHMPKKVNSNYYLFLFSAV